MNPDLRNPESLDALPIQIWTARADGMLDFVNRRVAEYFGVAREQVLEQGWKDLCHPYDLIDATAKWRHAIATGEPYEVYFRLLRGSDRQFRWHVGRAVAIVLPSGAVDYWAGSNCDVDLVRRGEEVANALASQYRRELDRLATGG